MVAPFIVRERLADKTTHTRKIGEEFAGLRGKHLDLLGPVETMIHEKAPLASSYDATRVQPPYFREFTHTEMLGTLVAAPQSSEIGARLIEYALANPTDDRFDVASALVNRDKYTLKEEEVAAHSRVLFTPGSNIIMATLSKETVDREMHRFPEMVIKPHPMTDAGTVKALGGSYGPDRILHPMLSGWQVLSKADTVYCTTSTEMGLYAVLLGKRIVNASRTQFEARGAYNAFYRTLWDLAPDEARERLRHILNSPYSGVFHPEDPNLSEKMETFFDLAMELREPFRPLVREYDPVDYAALISGHFKRTDHAESKDRP